MPTPVPVLHLTTRYWTIHRTTVAVVYPLVSLYKVWLARREVLVKGLVYNLHR
jgi:hypothetical protein